MRITNSMMASQQLRTIQANMAQLAKVQAQVSSGLRFQDASDDPSAAVQVIGTKSSLRALEQYKATIQRASSRVAMEDSVLQQIGDLVARAKELAVSQATGTATDQTRSIANAEVQQLFQQIGSLGNTKFGNEFLFGGDASETQPFAISGSGASLAYTSTSPQGQRSLVIGEGESVAPTHDGTQIFLNTGILDAVRDLVHSLAPGSATYGSAGITAAITKLDSAFTNVQTLVGETGANAQRLDSAGQNLDALKTNVATLQSNLQDVDIESAITELTNRQMAYQAALLATSKVSSLTLTDYLR